MRLPLRLAAACVVFVLLPAPASAWGFVGHRLIMSRAIDLLPAELKPFFLKHRDEIVVRVVDPDTWRVAGWPENPHHFLDFGVAEFGKFPFTELPREYDAALQKFGRSTLERNGLLPWRLAEFYGLLQRGFENFRRQSPYGVTDVILFSATASHYIQDAHQPFHASDNYDGQLTGQRGIHSRFEDHLIERFQARLMLAPSPPQPMLKPRDTAFEVLLASYQLVDGILQADKQAVAGKSVYDDDYFEKFFVAVKPVLERRLSESITATAALILGAWEAAGRPVPSLEVSRPVEKVGR
jgi:hypothetical protein